MRKTLLTLLTVMTLMSAQALAQLEFSDGGDARLKVTSTSADYSGISLGNSSGGGWDEWGSIKNKSGPMIYDSISHEFLIYETLDPTQTPLPTFQLAHSTCRERIDWLWLRLGWDAVAAEETA